MIVRKKRKSGFYFGSRKQRVSTQLNRTWGNNFINMVWVSCYLLKKYGYNLRREISLKRRPRIGIMTRDRSDFVLYAACDDLYGA